MGQVIGTGTPIQVSRANAGIIQQVGNINTTFDGGVQLAIVNVGDLIVIPVEYENTTDSLTGITAANGKVGSFARVAPRVVDTTLTFGLELWVGQSTGVGTEELTPVGTVVTNGDGYTIKSFEFTANWGPETQWFVDNSASADVTTSSTTITFANLGVPSFTPSLYFGTASVGGTPAAGNTSGFTYSVDTNNFCVETYRPNITTAVAPTATQSPSSHYLHAAGLFSAEQVNTTYDTTCDIRFPVVPTGIQWVIYQLSVEVISTIGLQAINATTYINHRSTYTLAVPGTIQGPPYYTIRPGDDLVVTVTGAPIGSQCVATLLYHEYLNGPTPPIAGVV